MRIFPVYICLLFTLKLLSQNSVVVTFDSKMHSYPIDTTKISDRQILKMMNSEIESVKKGLNYLEFELIANEEKSIFKSEVPMQRDNGIDLQNVLLFLDADGVYYTTKDLSIRQISFNNKKYNVLHSSGLNWELHNEENVILGYNVRKATTTKQLTNGEMFEIEAWFAPDLPFQYGIKEFNGLPGLILKLREKSFEYTAKKVKLKDAIEINKPENGINISQDEFTKIVRKYYAR